MDSVRTRALPVAARTIRSDRLQDPMTVDMIKARILSLFDGTLLSHRQQSGEFPEPWVPETCPRESASPSIGAGAGFPLKIWTYYLSKGNLTRGFPCRKNPTNRKAAAS